MLKGIAFAALLLVVGTAGGAQTQMLQTEPNATSSNANVAATASQPLSDVITYEFSLDDLELPLPADEDD